MDIKFALKGLTGGRTSELRLAFLYLTLAVN